MNLSLSGVNQLLYLFDEDEKTPNEISDSGYRPLYSWSLSTRLDHQSQDLDDHLSTDSSDDEPEPGPSQPVGGSPGPPDQDSKGEEED